MTGRAWRFVEDEWPLHKLTWRGRLVAEQPPVVGYVCKVQLKRDAVGDGKHCPAREFCTAPAEKCPYCAHPVCKVHRSDHGKRFRAPRDAFLKMVKFRPKWTQDAGIVVLSWCKPPSSGKVGLPCVLPTAKCSGSHAPCPLCKWSLCDGHRARHIRTTILRPDYWQRVDKRRNDGLDRAVELRPRKVRIRLTDPPPKDWGKDADKTTPKA